MHFASNLWFRSSLFLGNTMLSLYWIRNFIINLGNCLFYLAKANSNGLKLLVSDSKLKQHLNFIINDK